MGTPHKITERRIKALVLRLYLEYEKLHGSPEKPLKSVYVGKFDDPDKLGDTVQILKKSTITISNEFIGTRHIKLLGEVVRHELAHVWAGTHRKDKHDSVWRRWAAKFECKERFY